MMKLKWIIVIVLTAQFAGLAVLLYGEMRIKDSIVLAVFLINLYMTMVGFYFFNRLKDEIDFALFATNKKKE